ncbi:MAG TPA: hypothetical protein DCS18_16350 [Alcanivorax sp.]|jgi:hypothetical protein|nr:hypothetical protein [Alcanivorax sp.]HAV68697.1 hypothetical protein [Alcanivorax sp.]|tara:strand:- start:69201 stop:69533 length:333 start_codon:yes stop_codon:yes gene_type:complete
MKSLFESLLNGIATGFTAIVNSIPRLTSWALVAAALLAVVAILHPEQLRVVLWKLCLVALAAPVSYWIDRAIFPYGRPHAMKPDDGRREVAMFRRAIVFLAVVLGLTLGL